MAKEFKRCKLENGNAPGLPSLSKADIAETEEFLEQMLLVYPALGISIFQKSIAATSSTRLLYLDAKGFTATGYEASDGFVVRAGSQTPKDAVQSTPENVLKLRRYLVREGLLFEECDHFRLTQDYTFSSPSLAASCLIYAFRQRPGQCRRCQLIDTINPDWCRTRQT